MCTRGVRPNLRLENKFAIVSPVRRPGVVRLPTAEGPDASTRPCGSRSTRKVHNRRKSKLLAHHLFNGKVVYSENNKLANIKKYMVKNFCIFAEIENKNYVKT